MFWLMWFVFGGWILFLLYALVVHCLNCVRGPSVTLRWAEAFFAGPIKPEISTAGQKNEEGFLVPCCVSIEHGALRFRPSSGKWNRPIEHCVAMTQRLESNSYFEVGCPDWIR